MEGGIHIQIQSFWLCNTSNLYKLLVSRPLEEDQGLQFALEINLILWNLCLLFLKNRDCIKHILDRVRFRCYNTQSNKSSSGTLCFLCQFVSPENKSNILKVRICKNPLSKHYSTGAGVFFLSRKENFWQNFEKNIFLYIFLGQYIVKTACVLVSRASSPNNYFE